MEEEVARSFGGEEEEEEEASSSCVARQQKERKKRGSVSAPLGEEEESELRMKPPLHAYLY